MIELLREWNLLPICFVGDNAASVTAANNILVEWTESELNNLLSHPTMQRSSIAPRSDLLPSPLAAPSSLSPSEFEEGVQLRQSENRFDEISDEDSMEPPHDDVASIVASAFRLPVDSFGCHAHSIELSIKTSLDPIADVLQSLRAFAKSFRKSKATRDYFAHFSSTSMNFPGDCPTRWSSTFRLIDHFCAALDPLTNACNSYSGHPNIPGMDSLRELIATDSVYKLKRVRDVLRPTADCLRHLEGDSYPTLSMIQCQALILLNTIENQLTVEVRVTRAAANTVRAVYRKLKAEIRKRFIYTPSQMEEYMPIDYVAAALDPRTKLLSMVDTPEMKEKVWSWIQSRLDECDHALGSDLLPATAIEYDFEFSDRSRREFRGDGLSEELCRYRNMRTLYADQDPLAWWRRYEPAFPHLAQLAKIYLAIPASSASSERIFSRAGYTMNCRRTRLRDHTFEALVCFTSNIDYENDVQARKRPRTDNSANPLTLSSENVMPATPRASPTTHSPTMRGRTTFFPSSM